MATVVLRRIVAMGICCVCVVHATLGQRAEGASDVSVVEDTLGRILPWIFDDWTVQEWQDITWASGGAVSTTENSVVSSRWVWMHPPEPGAESGWQARQAVRLPRLRVDVGYGRSTEGPSLGAYRVEAMLHRGIGLHVGRTHLAAAAFHPRRRSWRAPDWRADRRSATTFAARPGGATGVTLTYAIGSRVEVSMQRALDDHLQRNIVTGVSRHEWGALSIGISNLVTQEAQGSGSTMVVMRGLYERDGLQCYGAVRAGLGMTGRARCSFEALPLIALSLGFVRGAAPRPHSEALRLHDERAEASHNVELKFRLPMLGIHGSVSRHTRWAEAQRQGPWRPEEVSEVWDTYVSAQLIGGRLVGRYQHRRNMGETVIAGTDRMMLRWSGRPAEVSVFVTFPSGNTKEIAGEGWGYNAEATIPLTRRVAMTQWVYLSRTAPVYIPTFWSNGVRSARATRGRGGGILVTASLGKNEAQKASLILSDGAVGWVCVLNI